MINRLCLFLALAVAAMLGQSADQNAIESATLYAFAPPNFTLDVHFTNVLDDPHNDLTPANLSLTPVPSTTTLAVESIQTLPGSRKSIQVLFSSPPPSTLTSVQVCFHSVTFRESSGSVQTVANVCGPVRILNADNIASEKAKVLKDLAAVPKTTDQKNIFASGFVTTASSGSAGGLDLDLNSKELGIPGLTAFLHTQKSSVAGGDPKNFEAGTNFRTVRSFAGKNLDALREHIGALRHAASQSDLDAAGNAINSEEQNIQKKLLSAWVVDMAGKLEGGATDFNVANYVGDGQVSILSRTKRLFGSRRGFWWFKIVPAGGEGGANAQTNVTSASGPEDHIARFKAGGDFTLFYDNPDSPLPFKRIELNLDTVQRYLFFKEPQTLSANALPVLADGHRPWYEANLLIYLAEAPSGRYGLRLDYKNGSLPPNFAVTKSFQFGFVFETKDGEQRLPTR
jgi:hypothetical protein